MISVQYFSKRCKHPKWTLKTFFIGSTGVFKSLSPSLFRLSCCPWSLEQTHVQRCPHGHAVWPWCGTVVLLLHEVALCAIPAISCTHMLTCVLDKLRSSSWDHVLIRLSGAPWNPWCLALHVILSCQPRHMHSIDVCWLLIFFCISYVHEYRGTQYVVDVMEFYSLNFVCCCYFFRYGLVFSWIIAAL